MEGFFTPEQIELPIAIREHAWRCSSSIETADGGRCSGTFISPEGHFLTALHCIGRWISDLGLGESRSEPGAIKLVSVLKQYPSGARADGFYLGDFPDIANPSIAFLGKGIQYFERERVSEMKEHEIDSIAELYEDLAILKFDLDGRQIPFARIAGELPAPGTPVWHISKPYAVNRQNGPSSDGSTKYVTSGKIISLKDSPAFENVCCENCHREKLLRYYSRGRLFTTVDYHYGSSGGGIFNAEGELLGLNAISLHDPGNGYLAGSAGFHVLIQQYLVRTK